MSHEIESAVYSANEGAGWTGLGQSIPQSAAHDPKQIATICNALYSVEKRDIGVLGDGIPKALAGYQALVRSDTGEVLHVASRSRYHVENRQPIDIFEAFRDELAKESLEISHAAVLKGGRLIAVSALLNGSTLDDPQRKGDIKSYVTLSTGYDGMHGTAATVDSLRVVCANTWRANLSNAQASGKHRAIRASTRIQETTLADIVANIDGIMSAQKRTYDALANATMSEADVLRLFADVCKITVADLDRTDAQGKPVVSTKARNMLDALNASYRNAPGASQGTAWGAFQAITHFATHVRTVRDTALDGDAATRVASNLFGDSARMKTAALDKLTAQYAMAA